MPYVMRLTRIRSFIVKYIQQTYTDTYTNYTDLTEKAWSVEFKDVLNTLIITLHCTTENACQKSKFVVYNHLSV